MLSQSTGYAACALGCIAAMGGKPSMIRVVAQMCEVPAAYLAKIINTLARRGVVRTQRGAGGGVTLARPADQITLLDLCGALDDPIVTPRCMLGNAVCSDDRDCPAHAFCVDCRAKMRAFLSRTTVADMAAFETRRRWKATSGAARAARSRPPRRAPRPTGD